MEYKKLPIDVIRPDPRQPRKYMDEENLKGMSVSIKNEGIINAIEVDEKFVIITGEQRWRAAKLVGLKEVPVKILRNLSEKERFIRQVQENIHHNTMSPLDTAEALEKVRQLLLPTASEPENDKMIRGIKVLKGVKEMHQMFGTPESTLTELLDLLGVKGELRKALKDPKFARSKVTELRFVNPKYKKQMEKVISVQRKLPRDTIRALVKAVNLAAKYGEHDRIQKLLVQNFENLSTYDATVQINRIVPGEESRVKGPADAVKKTLAKIIDLMEVLDETPLESLDDLHRGMLVKDINGLGFYLTNFLKGKKIEASKVKMLGIKN
jgi:hypothetical protein